MANLSRIGKSDDASFSVSDERARLSRVKHLVRDNGGPAAVAERAHISASALDQYIGGHEMTVSDMVALARACNVSVEFVATGFVVDRVVREALRLEFVKAGNLKKRRVDQSIRDLAREILRLREVGTAHEATFTALIEKLSRARDPQSALISMASEMEGRNELR